MTRLHKMYHELDSMRDPSHEDQEDATAARLGLLHRAMRTIPQPVCCFEAKNQRAIFWRLDEDRYGEGRVPTTGFWHILLAPNFLGYDHTVLSSFFRGRYDHEEKLFKIIVCPFCGEKMPKVRRKAELPSPILNWDPENGYCKTCKDRCCNCTCFPPEAAYEPVPKPKKRSK